MCERDALVCLALLAAVLAAAVGVGAGLGRLEPGGPVPVRAEAVILADAPYRYSFPEALVPPRVAVAAAWTAPNGSGRVGEIDVPAGTPAGRVVGVWVDANGAPVPPPPASDPVSAGFGAGVGVLVAAMALIASLRVRDARRGRRWDAEWADLEPRWSGRARPPS
jgi:hypothetical protein